MLGIFRRMVLWVMVVFFSVSWAGCSQPTPPKTQEEAMANEEQNLNTLIEEVENDPSLNDEQKKKKIDDIRQGFEAQSKMIEAHFSNQDIDRQQ